MLLVGVLWGLTVLLVGVVEVGSVASWCCGG